MQSSIYADPPPALKASAPSFTPATTSSSFDPGPPDSFVVGDTVDEFASTRPPDDLFDDDFTPIAELLTESVASSATPQALLGRGGGQRGNIGRRGRANIANAQPQPHPRTHPPKPASSPPPNAPEGPKADAVRGDRSGTGGLKKDKLTEDELTARMEAMKLKNASLLAAHARAEADETSFQEREALAQQRRKEDRQNRQQMMGERERNRLRKLKAVEGREWDAEKKEEDYGGGGRGGSQFRRGAHGGVLYVGHKNQDVAEVYSGGDKDSMDSEYVPPGRVRGRGRGRGRSRGAYEGNRGPQALQQYGQTVPQDSDFPALPPATKPTSENTAKTTDSQIPASKEGQEPTVVSSPMAGQSWAEQVENA